MNTFKIPQKNKNIISLAALLFCIFFTLASTAQNLIGAWENYNTLDDGNQVKNVIIYSDGFYAISTYHAKTGKFISTKGGSWKLKDNTLSQQIEFDTQKPENVGTKKSYTIAITDTTLAITDSNTKYTRIDDGTPGKLKGAWLMSGRVRDGKTQQRDTNRPRKTMKILSGTRFQWIAYNTETKQFMGTGGGTYTTQDGKYTENIKFFSRDDTRVGNSLQFNYELKEGHWHHSGLSSKGDPIHEIWSKR